MQPRRLGQSDILLSPIGLGCWQFSQGKSISGKFWAVLADESIHAIVKTSLENGINWFDTAEAYGDGRSEQMLAQGLQYAQAPKEKAIIATKWQPALHFASSIINTIDIRLKMLEGYPISLYQIHQPLSFSSIENQMKAMAMLVSQNKIKTIGVSNFGLVYMRRAHKSLQAQGLNLASNQMRFSLLDRSIEKNGVLDYAKDNGITIIAYSPLAQGILSGKFNANPELIKKTAGFRKFLPGFKQGKLRRFQPLFDKLNELAANYRMTPAQVALNWAINFHGDTIVAIPGATSTGQADQNARAMNFSLTRQELNELGNISREILNF